jgi:hypothetical protein
MPVSKDDFTDSAASVERPPTITTLKNSVGKKLLKTYDILGKILIKSINKLLVFDVMGG